MKRDDDFIDYWNRRVKYEKREENKGWIYVSIFWIVAFIALYSIFK